MIAELVAKNAKIFDLDVLKGYDKEKVAVIYNRVFGVATLAKADNADRDSKGNRLRVSKGEVEEIERGGDILEPYDPAYLEESDDKNPYAISAEEKAFIRKVSILENRMKKLGLYGEWDANSRMFTIEKFLGKSEYPTLRFLYVDMDDNTYNFSNEKEVFEYSTNVKEVVEAAKKWFDKKLKK